MPIVCGTDFSVTADHAVTAAAVIARRAGTSLELVCATGARLHVAAFPDTAQGLHLGAATRAEQLAAQVARLRGDGIAADGTLDPQVAEDALVSRARQHDVPLVVLGAVGHSTIERLLVGSVAGRVAMTSPKPVLVVREGGSWQRWRDGGAPLRVLVAFDAGHSARAAMAWGGWLASLGNVQLTAGWVVHPAFENQRLGAGGPGAGVELLPATHDALESEFAARVAEALPDRPVELQLEPNLGRVDSALIELAHARHTDLLVVGSHQRHGFERLWEASVSRGVLHHAPMSVAVVPFTA